MFPRLDPKATSHTNLTFSNSINNPLIHHPPIQPIHGVVIILPRTNHINPRYAEVAARNSEQTVEEASAPVPQTIIPNESIGSDIASYSTGNSILDETASSTSGPGGVHVINRSELSHLDTSSDQVIPASGPSIGLNAPVIHDETGEILGTEGTSEESSSGILKGKKFSKKDKEVVVYSGIGTLNLLALGGIGYWGWRRYSGGENVWKVIGIAAGAWAGLTAFEWLSVRYPFSLGRN
jgi:hypothetical protein